MGLCQAHSSASFSVRVTAQHPVVRKSPVTSLSALLRVALKRECLLESLGALCTSDSWASPMEILIRKLSWWVWGPKRASLLASL